MNSQDCNPLISVIVPVYNIEAYIRKCIESITGQSYLNMEIILVDDGSTDNSGKICDDYASIDNRIIVIHKENGGLVSARKAGAKVASGDYIVNVDGDDWIDKDRFLKLVEKGLNDSPDMVYMDGIYKDYGSDSILTESLNLPRVFDRTQLRSDLMNRVAGYNIFLERDVALTQWAWCVKKSIYINNQLNIDEHIQMGEDFIMVFSCLLDSEKIVCINEPSYHYIQRVGSIVYKTSKWDDNHTKIFYNNIKDIMSNHLVNKEILNVAVQYIYRDMFITNYKRLYDYYSEYLFPFSNVKNGSKIIVYGAGNIGSKIVSVIESEKRYELVAWIDKNPRNNKKNAHKVENISVIEKKVYDFIVVAILVSQISMQVKHDLVNMGIDKDKVVLMDSRLMNMEDLDRMLG